jgi:hypothetical protein
MAKNSVPNAGRGVYRRAQHPRRSGRPTKPTPAAKSRLDCDAAPLPRALGYDLVGGHGHSLERHRGGKRPLRSVPWSH